MKINELIKMKKPLIHEIYCNWIDLENNINLNEELYVAIIDGFNCKSDDLVFLEFAKVFKFPDYFGNNWDAFDECINDLDWISSNSYVLIIKDANYLLEKEPEDFNLLVQILKDTAEEWLVGRNDDDFPTEPTPFHLFFHSEKEKKDVLNKRLNEALFVCDYDEIVI